MRGAVTEQPDARAQAASEQHDEQPETKVINGLKFAGQLRNVPTPSPSMVSEVPLTVPDVEGPDTLTAALQYADCGCYIAPTAADDPKNPGSVLGRDWQRKSSRDPR